MKPTAAQAKSRAFSILRKIFFILVYALPAVLYFSYYPIIRLGSNESMNFELSLPLIWLVVFNLVSAVIVINNLFFGVPSRESQAATTERSPHKDRRANGGRQKIKYYFLLFPLFATLSLLWTPNLTRAILTVGVLWLVFFAVLALLKLPPALNPPATFRQTLLKVFFISSALVCLFCWLQCILDICGVPREQTLLCLGCTYRSFGFPHPSGFAIEPQFMGNLLLAPTLIALYLLVFGKHQRHQNIALIFFACLFSSTLFLTFSRGAIYAYAVALFILFIFTLVKHKFKVSLIFIPVFTFVLTLGAQALFATLGPTHESPYVAFAKSIHQLSLGIIDLRPQNRALETDLIDTGEEIIDADASVVDKTITAVEQETSVFEGYVAESTNIRLNLNEVALGTWLAAPSNLIIGVGLGGAGTVMHALFPDQVTSPKEIVQNQIFSILVELGAIGVFLVHLLFVLAFLAPFLPWWLAGREKQSVPLRTRFRQDAFWSHSALPLLAALIIAYLITLQFFSGLPNALQIYLLPPLLFIALKSPCKSPAGVVT